MVSSGAAGTRVLADTRHMPAGTRRSDRFNKTVRLACNQPGRANPGSATCCSYIPFRTVKDEQAHKQAYNHPTKPKIGRCCVSMQCAGDQTTHNGVGNNRRVTALILLLQAHLYSSPACSWRTALHRCGCLHASTGRTSQPHQGQGKSKTTWAHARIGKSLLSWAGRSLTQKEGRTSAYSMRCSQ